MHSLYETVLVGSYLGVTGGRSRMLGLVLTGLMMTHEPNRSDDRAHENLSCEPTRTPVLDVLSNEDHRSKPQTSSTPLPPTQNTSPLPHIARHHHARQRSQMSLFNTRNRSPKTISRAPNPTKLLRMCNDNNNAPPPGDRTDRPQTSLVQPGVHIAHAASSRPKTVPIAGSLGAG